MTDLLVDALLGVAKFAMCLGVMYGLLLLIFALAPRDIREEFKAERRQIAHGVRAAYRDSRRARAHRRDPRTPTQRRDDDAFLAIADNLDPDWRKKAQARLASEGQ